MQAGMRDWNGRRAAALCCVRGLERDEEKYIARAHLEGDRTELGARRSDRGQRTWRRQTRSCMRGLERVDEKYTARAHLESDLRGRNGACLHENGLCVGPEACEGCGTSESVAFGGF